MAYELIWTEEAHSRFDELRLAAEQAAATRKKEKRAKASRQEGLFKQVVKCIDLLVSNPRHPGLQTNEFHSSENPYDSAKKVFECYVQNRTLSSSWQMSRETLHSGIAHGPRRRDDAVLSEIRASLDNEGPVARTPAAAARLLPWATQAYRLFWCYGPGRNQITIIAITPHP
jgi:hypothetical protein